MYASSAKMRDVTSSPKSLEENALSRLHFSQTEAILCVCEFCENAECNEHFSQARNACSKSPIISLALSVPIERRIVFGLIP